MASKTVIEGSSVSASQLKELFSQIAGGALDGDHIQAVIEHRDPFVERTTRKWREEKGVIYFSVTSDGTTGEEWITRLEKKGFRVGDEAKRILLSPDFSPTEYVMTEVAVFKRRSLFGEKCNWVTTDDLHTEADNRNLGKPNTEVACLIREKFTDKEIGAMDLTDVVIMHEPVNGPDGVQWQLVVLDPFMYPRLFEACSVTPSYEWHGDRVGFAFAKSQEKYIPRPW